MKVASIFLTLGLIWSLRRGFQMLSLILPTKALVQKVMSKKRSSKSTTWCARLPAEAEQAALRPVLQRFRWDHGSFSYEHLDEMKTIWKEEQHFILLLNSTAHSKKNHLSRNMHCLQTRSTVEKCSYAADKLQVAKMWSNKITSIRFKFWWSASNTFPSNPHVHGDLCSLLQDRMK